jgi:hypothetical protein
MLRRVLWHISKLFLFLSPFPKPEEFFFNNSCENLVEFLEAEVTKA